MIDLPGTRQSLLIRLADRSQDAWVEFVQIYEQAIIAFARRKGLQEADALDLTQQVLQAVEAKLPRWNLSPQHGSFRGWLFRVARNIAVDKVKSRLRGPAIGLHSDSWVQVESSELSNEFDIDFARRVFEWSLQRARPKFSEKTWQAFWMTAIERRPPSEVAAETELTVGNVYAAKFRVISDLQKQVRRFEEESKSNSVHFAGPTRTPDVVSSEQDGGEPK